MRSDSYCPKDLQAVVISKCMSLGLFEARQSKRAAAAHSHLHTQGVQAVKTCM